MAARILAAALIGASAMTPARAEENRKDNSAARVAAANDMYDVCGERKQIEVYFENVAAHLVTLTRVQTPTYSDAQWKAYQAIVTQDLMKGIDDYIAYRTASYAEHFTLQDIRDMTAFCRSPLGKKVSDMRAQIENDTYAYRQDWLQSALRAAAADAQQKLQAGGNAL